MNFCELYITYNYFIFLILILILASSSLKLRKTLRSHEINLI